MREQAYRSAMVSWDTYMIDASAMTVAELKQATRDHWVEEGDIDSAVFVGHKAPDRFVYNVELRNREGDDGVMQMQSTLSADGSSLDYEWVAGEGVFSTLEPLMSAKGRVMFASCICEDALLGGAFTQAVANLSDADVITATSLQYSAIWLSGQLTSAVPALEKVPSDQWTDKAVAEANESIKIRSLS
jgi:hypothetical protein